MTKLVKKDPEVDLKIRYKKTLELSFIVVLLLIIFLLYAFKKFERKIEPPPPPDIKVETIVIPPTKQQQAPPPISRPSLPVEAEDDELLDDVTIQDTEIIISTTEDTPPPPPPDDDIIFEFFAVSEKPELIHKVQPSYPDLARRANIEGTVVVTVTIGKDGSVEDAVIFKSMPMLDNAALEAAKQCKFKPAKQRDKTVRVKMYMPFQFTLKN
jgi:protein TonB